VVLLWQTADGEPIMWEEASADGVMLPAVPREITTGYIEQTPEEIVSHVTQAQAATVVAYWEVPVETVEVSGGG
jgi:hypothetical protein